MEEQKIQKLQNKLPEIRKVGAYIAFINNLTDDELLDLCVKASENQESDNFYPKLENLVFIYAVQNGKTSRPI